MQPFPANPIPPGALCAPFSSVAMRVTHKPYKLVVPLLLTPRHTSGAYKGSGAEQAWGEKGPVGPLLLLGWGQLFVRIIINK